MIIEEPPRNQYRQSKPRPPQDYNPRQRRQNFERPLFQRAQSQSQPQPQPQQYQQIQSTQQVPHQAFKRLAQPVPRPAPQHQHYYQHGVPHQIQEILKFQAHLPYQPIGQSHHNVAFSPDRPHGYVPEAVQQHYHQHAAHQAQRRRRQAPLHHRRQYRQQPQQQDDELPAHQAYKRLARPAIEQQPHYSNQVPKEIQEILKFQANIPYNIIANSIAVKPVNYVPEPIQPQQIPQQQQQVVETRQQYVMKPGVRYYQIPQTSQDHFHTVTAQYQVESGHAYNEPQLQQQEQKSSEGLLYRNNARQEPDTLGSVQFQRGFRPIDTSTSYLYPQNYQDDIRPVNERQQRFVIREE